MSAYVRLLTYLRPHGAVLVAAVFLSLAILMLQAISVWVGAGFVEQIVTGERPQLPTSGFPALTRLLDTVVQRVLLRPTAFQSLLMGILVLVGARLSVSLLRVVKVLMIARANQSVLVTIRNQLFAHLTRLDLSFSQRFRSGEVAAVFSNDIDQLNVALFDAIDRSFLQPARLVVALLLMASISVQLTGWIALALIIGAVSVHLIGNRIERLCTSALRSIGVLQGHLTEYLSAAVLARIFNREADERQRFRRTSSRVGDTMVKIVFMRTLAPEMIQTIFITAGALLLLLAGRRVLSDGGLTAAEMLRLALLIPLATYSTEGLASMYTSVRTSVASAKRVFRLLDLQEIPPDPPDAVVPGPLRDAIEFVGVDYSVDGVEILRGIDLRIPRGKRVVVFGPTGAGKSTLIGLLAGYLPCTAGRIEVDGLDLARTKLSAWRERLAIVPQVPLLLNATVRENLLYALPAASDEQLEEVLRRALMWPDPRALPQGLDTAVGNRGEFMSGGERQRLTLARALLSDPEILILDEPTSMLDRPTRERIRETILSVSEDRTVVLVTHDETLRDIADLSYLLEGGRIVRSAHPTPQGRQQLPISP